MIITDATIKPLSWPTYWKRPTEVQNFLKGVPFVGIDKRARRHFWNLLNKRSPSCLLEWGRDSDTLLMLLFISPIIQEWMEWPNIYFIPSDPCDILFFMPTMDSDLVELTLEIENALGVQKPSIIDYIENRTYGEFIHKLIEFQQLNLQNNG